MILECGPGLKIFFEFVNTVKENFKDVDTKFVVLKRALGSALNRSEDGNGLKVEVPEPCYFSGTRSVKELENLLWDVVQYFKPARVPELEQVTFTSMYLSGDAKLWW